MSQAVHGGITGQSGQVAWPVLSGLMPPLADSYTPRAESGPDPADDLHPGETVVLVTAGNAARALGGMGGIGKTQLAAAIAHTLWTRGAVDLVLWVTASSRDAVLTGYAQALGDVGLPDPYEGPEAAASHFLAWLAETPRPWLAVLDDLSDPAVLDGLWPWGTHGRVLVTTNRPDAALRAHSPRAVELGPFSDRESLAYLSTRLQADRDQWTGALDLAADLGFLPIALAQAGTLMAYTGIDCHEYRTRMADWRQRLAAGNGALPPAVADTGALALEFADRLPPTGLARPMLALISMLDPNGIPGAVLTTPAACAYLGRFGAAPVDEVQARTAVHALGRLGLVTIDTTSAARTVRVHELVQAASRQSLSTAECDTAALAAADALAQAWPPPQAVPAASGQALRDCTARLRQIAGVLLWNPECHPVLLRAGQCLDDAGLAGPAIAYWQSMIDIGRPTLGAAHAHTILASDRLAAAYDAAGRPMDAIPVHERVLAEREREPGPHLPRGRPRRGCRPAGRARAGRLRADARTRAPGQPGRAFRARPGLPQRRAPRSGHHRLRACPGRAGEGSGAPSSGHPDRPGERRPRVPGGGTAEGRDLAVQARPGRPGTGAGPRPPGHADGPRQPRRYVPSGQQAQGRPAAVRTDVRRPGTGAGPRPPGHHHRLRQPGVRLPFGAQADHGAPAVRAHARRLRAGARRRPPGHPGLAGQPRPRLPHGGPVDGGAGRVRAHAGGVRARAGCGPSADRDRPRELPGRRAVLSPRSPGPSWAG